MSDFADHRIFVIGMGEVGGRLGNALRHAGCKVLPVRRESGWDEALDERDPSPRVVAVREEALSGVLARFDESTYDRLVLVQNGFLEAVHGDLSRVARGLIWFTSKKEFFRTLCPSPFHGTAARPLVEPLQASGLDTEWLPEVSAFQRAMILKGIWNAVVGLPLAVHEIDLAGYLEHRSEELAELTEESARACSAAYGVRVTGEEARRKILETTTELGWVRGGAKALAWRNGAIAWFGRENGIPTPVNDRLLRAVGYDPDATPRDQTG